MNQPGGTDRRMFLRQSALLAGATVLPTKGAPATISSAPTLAIGTANLEDIISISDAEEIARKVTPESFFAYLNTGAGDEFTLRWNQEKFQEIRLNPRVLADLGHLDTKLSLFGCDMPAPVLFAPTACNRLMHPEGELAVARGASLTNTTYVLSTTSNTSVEAVAANLQSPLWFQLYMQVDMQLTKDLIRRSEAAGSKVLCITVDNPVPGSRSRQERAKFSLPPSLELPHFVRRLPPGRYSLDQVVPVKLHWNDVEELINYARTPVILKGIMTPEDAERALQIGAAGIVVSNHGGRNLDTVPATIEVLPGIARQIAGRVPILIDGGIRRGTDIVKALALGAQAVLIGRPYLYGLAAGGAEGVAHIQRVLLRELRMALALLGCRDIRAITTDVLWNGKRS